LFGGFRFIIDICKKINGNENYTISFEHINMQYNSSKYGLKKLNRK